MSERWIYACTDRRNEAERVVLGLSYERIGRWRSRYTDGSRLCYAWIYFTVLDYQLSICIAPFRRRFL